MKCTCGPCPNCLEGCEACGYTGRSHSLKCPVHNPPQRGGLAVILLIFVLLLVACGGPREQSGPSPLPAPRAQIAVPTATPAPTATPTAVSTATPASVLATTIPLPIIPQEDFGEYLVVEIIVTEELGDGPIPIPIEDWEALFVSNFSPFLLSITCNKEVTILFSMEWGLFADCGVIILEKIGLDESRPDQLPEGNNL